MNQKPLSGVGRTASNGYSPDSREMMDSMSWTRSVCTVLKALRKKLAYWSTVKLSLASHVLIANQVLLASIWYVASCWNPQLRSINQVKALIRNYIWSGENGERKCRAKVAWDSLIPQNAGGLKLLDPELQIHALLAKMFIRGLMPKVAPWRTLIKHRMATLRPKRGGNWPPHIHFILFATRVQGIGSPLWWGI